MGRERLKSEIKSDMKIDGVNEWGVGYLNLWCMLNSYSNYI